MTNRSHAPVTAPLSWGKRDPRHEAAVRSQSARIVEAVLKRTEGWAALDQALEIGGACPFTKPSDRRIWLEEVHRLEAAPVCAHCRGRVTNPATHICEGEAL